MGEIDQGRKNPGGLVIVSQSRTLRILAEIKFAPSRCFEWVAS